MKIVQGQLKETVYNWPRDRNVQEPLEVNRTKIHNTNEVTYICGKINYFKCLIQYWEKFYVIRLVLQNFNSYLRRMLKILFAQKKCC